MKLKDTGLTAQDIKDKIFYQNSGTEANEAMIKMARKYGIEKYGPNKYHIVTAKMGFHGRTFGAMSATGQPGNGCQVGFGPMTYGFSYAPYNDLEAFKNACTENTIAIMVEPVQNRCGDEFYELRNQAGYRLNGKSPWWRYADWRNLRKCGGCKSVLRRKPRNHIWRTSRKLCRSPCRSQ